MGLGILGNPLECFKHEIELTDGSKIGFSTIRTAKLVFLYVRFHFIMRPSIDGFRFSTLFAVIILNELVSTKTGFALFTIHQWVVEAANMT